MRFFMVPSRSMEPTLYPKDYLVTLTAGTYQRGDVVVVREQSEGKKEYVVKRIVGLGGDEVKVEGGALSLNEEYASEPYVFEPMAYEFGPVTVAEGEAFLLGDNRNLSEDSHNDLRGVPLDAVVGKVRWIYSPYSRFGPVHSYPLTNVSGR